MSNAPYCNVNIATPKGDPRKPGTGLQTVPPGASLQQITNIVNNNFLNLVKGNFTEDRAQRQVIITRIFDPNDSSVWVDVRQIVGLSFVNGFTGQTIQWQQ